MKKNFLFVGAMIAMFAIGMSTVLVSCEKDTEKSSRSADDDDDEDEDEDIKGCKCTVMFEGESDTEKISLEDMEDYYNVSTCSALEKAITRAAREEGVDDFSISCKSY